MDVAGRTRARTSTTHHIWCRVAARALIHERSTRRPTPTTRATCQVAFKRYVPTTDSTSLISLIDALLEAAADRRQPGRRDLPGVDQGLDEALRRPAEETIQHVADGPTRLPGLGDRRGVAVGLAFELALRLA